MSGGRVGGMAIFQLFLLLLSVALLCYLLVTIIWPERF
jgi:K+-transporting ATPase KdpF subunit